MKTETQSNAERAQLCKLIENLPVAMLTHLDADGALVSRPMAPLEMDRDGALWFFTDLHSVNLEHLHVVNLSFADPAHATYVSLSGRGQIHTDRKRIEQLWTPLARPWFPDGPASTNLALLKVLPDSAEFWDAPNSTMARMVAMAASVVVGKPIALGNHDKLTGLKKSA